MRTLTAPAGEAVVRQHHRRSGLLGTVIDVVVEAEPGVGADASGAIFEEIERLEGIFNWFDDTSELRRWSRGEAAPGYELAEVAELAQQWKNRSRGAFDPGAGVLTALWNEAAQLGRVPSQMEILDAVQSMEVSLDRHSLNAIAKGWIVDQAARRAVGAGLLYNLVINAGGDLLHVGSDPIAVGIEDPCRPYDNATPLLRVRVDNGSLATSGSARRGWSIAGERYSHVLDPRSGWPAGHVTSASVLAPDTATADVMATILTVVEIDEGLALSEEIGVACCVIDENGSAHLNRQWPVALSASHTEPAGSSQPALRVPS